MALSLQGVQELASDQASLTAASKLRAAAKWPLSARLSDGTVAWGECRGSGSTPYRVASTPPDRGYTCSCPSRKLPCKHVLALLWRLVEEPEAFAELEPPAWVQDWLGRRRPRSPGQAAPGPRRTGGPKDIRAAELAARPRPEDPAEAEKKQARSAEAAERRREEREASISAGLADLDQWLADELAEGLGTFPARMTERCRLASARLVDARAAGLASTLDDLPQRLFALPEDDRVRAAADALGRLALLVRAYRRQDHLPSALKEDVRSRVGWTVRKESLLQNPRTLRIADRWRVLAVRSEVQADDLVRYETWLRRSAETAPRWAALFDFVPRAASGSAPYRPGEVLAAELVFYPSAQPLRALVAETGEPVAEAEDPSLGFGDPAPSLTAAWAEVRRAWAIQPWLGAVPFSAAGVELGELGGRLHLADDDAMMPVAADDRPHTEALASAGPFVAFGLATPFGHRLLAARSALGPWYAT